jgi:hypothetical protein
MNSYSVGTLRPAIILLKGNRAFIAKRLKTTGLNFRVYRTYWRESYVNFIIGWRILYWVHSKKHRIKQGDIYSFILQSNL